LAANGFSFKDVAELIKTENQDIAAGRLYSDVHEFSTRTSGRFSNISEIKRLSLLNQQQEQIDKFELPDGYTVYLGGSDKILREGQDLSLYLLALAIFLVFVVMAVQYESLMNPLVILIGIPFTLTGVAIGIEYSAIPISMPVWLGLIMLTGLVVNNAIVLVEQIENTLKQDQELNVKDGTIIAAKLRLRPILMTTLTTVFGMLPLALASGEGAEMLRPLAIVIVSGLSYSLLVSLLLIPIIYILLKKITQTDNLF